MSLQPIERFIRYFSQDQSSGMTKIELQADMVKQLKTTTDCISSFKILQKSGFYG